MKKNAKVKSRIPIALFFVFDTAVNKDKYN